MTTATMTFRDISSVAAYCRTIYGDEIHEELEAIRDESDLMDRDYIDLMLDAALPGCLVRHTRSEVVIEIDFDNEGRAVASLRLPEKL